MRDEALAAAQEIVVTVAASPGAHGGDIAAGRRLAEAECNQPFAAGQPRQVAGLLLLVAREQDGQRGELLDDRYQAGGRVGARDLLDHDRLADAVELGSPKRGREGGAQQILLGQQLLEVPRKLSLRVDLGRTWGDSLLRQLANDGAQLNVLIRQPVGHPIGPCTSTCSPLMRAR